MKKAHPLWDTLRALRGNQRACVLSEPLWAIPFQLILPFASVYMVANGLSDMQIGWAASIGLAAQFLSALYSGAIVDKYGRRTSMLVFGFVCWCMPNLLWAGAGSFRADAGMGVFWMFSAAAFLNGLWRITGNSFACLVVEDGDESRLVHIFTILGFIGMLAGFLSPVIGLFIDRFTLAPTMRAVYLIAFVSMSAKFLVQYRMSAESRIGLRRIGECRGRSLTALTFGGWRAFLGEFRQARMMSIVALLTLFNCFNIVQSTFWPLFVTGRYRLEPAMLSVFPVIKSVVTIAAYLLITPHVRANAIRRPALAGIAMQAVGLAVLMLGLPSRLFAAVIVSAVCDALALAVLGPMGDSMMALAIPSEIRARANSLITAMIMLLAMPVGWIAGWLSQRDRILPLMLNLVLLAAEVLMALRVAKRQAEADVRAASTV